MNGLFSALNEKERRQLRLLCLLVLVAVFGLVLFSLGKRRSYQLSLETLRAREKLAASAEAKLAESAAQWAKWQEAGQDIKDLKEKFFYPGSGDISPLRLDLQTVFSEAGVSTRSFRYHYVSADKERIGKINVTFTLIGSYAVLRRFLQALEKFPKFLLLEKIDFLKVGADGSILELRITLAAYYASD